MFSRLYNIFSRQQEQQHDVEDELLLENDDLNEEQVLGEVVVDNDEDVDVENDEEIAEAKPDALPTLQGQIAECLEILEQAREAAQREKSHSSVKRKYYVYTVLALVTSITAVVAPGLFFTIFYHRMFPSVEWVLAQCKEQLEQLESQFTKANHKHAETYKKFSESLEPITKLLKPYITSWQQYDADASNCMIQHDAAHYYVKDPLDHVKAGYFCVMEQKTLTPDYDDFPSRCRAIASDACEVEKANSDLVATQRVWEAKVTQEYNALIEIRDELHHWQSIQKNPKSMMQPSGPLLWTGGGLFMTGVIAVTLTAILYGNARDKYKQDIAVFDRLANASPDFVNSQEFAILSDKLGINHGEEATVDYLIYLLKQRSDDIEYRWKQRIAFLAAASRPGSSAFSFFQRDASRDVTRIILDYANLGPVVRRP